MVHPYRSLHPTVTIAASKRGAAIAAFIRGAAITVNDHPPTALSWQDVSCSTITGQQQSAFGGGVVLVYHSALTDLA